MDSRALAVMVVAGAAMGMVLRPAPTLEPSVPQIVAAPQTVRSLTVVPKVVRVASVTRIPALIGAKGLTNLAASLAHYLQVTYPTIREIGGVRPCDSVGDHCRGVALDVMVGKDTALGNTILGDVLAHADRFGIRYAIFREVYHSASGASHWMSDRGSPTQNHMDHVHLSVVS